MLPRRKVIGGASQNKVIYHSYTIDRASDTFAITSKVRGKSRNIADSRHSKAELTIETAAQDIKNTTVKRGIKAEGSE